jgi:glucosamine--fructose-6-phosphate aminotransferase (isomerizing)
MATLSKGAFFRKRVPGKLIQLEEKIRACPLPGTVGIGHTRWATHGAPTEKNAHPLEGKHVVLAHNGIIENHEALRAQFSMDPFDSETDSEGIVHLLDAYRERGMPLSEAMSQLFQVLQGSYALAILFRDEPDTLIGARSGSPLVVGYGREGRLFLASDVVAFSDFCDEVTYLEEGDWVELKGAQATIHPDGGSGVVVRPRVPIGETMKVLTKEPYRHFMRKEIQEQPAVLRHLLTTLSDPLKKNTVAWASLSNLCIVACGTSFYAGCVAKYWFEKVARLSVRVEIASEFRYNHPALPLGTGALFVSQSGETADTLAALRFAKQQGIFCIGIVNVPESSLAREADVLWQTHSGVEVGVASTKAFTAQLAVLWHLVEEAAEQRKALSSEEKKTLDRAFQTLPEQVEEALLLDASLQKLAARFGHTTSALYLGRGALHPIAMEGALKLKEISYIHAEGYAAGELKHGPIALVEDALPIVVLSPYDALFPKTLSNIQEVLARRGQVILFTDPEGAEAVHSLSHRLHLYTLPQVSPIFAPIVYTIPMQLFAYHVAASRGTDVDQPRNLAKSVTVE